MPRARLCHPGDGVATIAPAHYAGDDMHDEQAWALEERLWLEGSSVYDGLLDPECIMVFPGVGVMRAAGILRGLRDAPRWLSVEMTDRAIGRPSDSLVVLGYTAEGRRAGAAPYRCCCSSTYRVDRGTWKLVQHQQTLHG